MRNFFVAAAACASISFHVSAQAISLHAGETVTVRFDSGRTVVERAGPAEPMTKYQAYVLWRAEAQDIPPGAKTMPPSFVIRGEGPPKPSPPTADQLKLTLRRVPGLEPGSADRTALFLANGYGSKVRYHAVMNADSRSASTDVCDVPARLLGMEYWPYIIDRIDLSELHLEPADGALRCG